ncbi:MAG: hypothetical protein IT353_02480 [Gemmatimonadaceae bacterium]|nr:hypothetical protein [Gemmatimonadaceae bacterium]
MNQRILRLRIVSGLALVLSVSAIRVRAMGQGAGSAVFFLDDGSGSSNMRTRPPAWSRADHDFVQVDAGHNDSPTSFRGERKLTQLAKVSVAALATVLAALLFAAWKLRSR